MKYTVSFFKEQKDKINKMLDITKVVMLCAGIISILVIFVLHILQTEMGARGIIGLASNFSKKTSSTVSVKDIVESYPVFNSSNYVLDNTKINEVAKENEIKQEEQKEEIPAFDVTVVDSIKLLDITKKANLKITNTSSYQKANIYGISILNYSTKRDIDYKALFDTKVSLIKKNDPILMYCTHTSETYTKSDRYDIKYTGNYRIRDSEYNMLSVAKVAAETLKGKSFNVTFDTTPHDYTSYQNAYKNSKKTINKNLGNGKYGMVIDVHRDASGNLSYAPTVNVNGKKVAKLMLVLGVGTKGYENKYWKENLSLAVKIMRVGESMYPGLFKPMIIRNSKYNQDLNKNSFLVEVGATGNTLEEAYLGARCLANILNKIYE